jgi:hypothetical protein
MEMMEMRTRRAHEIMCGLLCCFTRANLRYLRPVDGTVRYEPSECELDGMQLPWMWKCFGVLGAAFA